MKIKSLYDRYFQKSKVFLYPLLGIKRGVSTIPSETYLAWDPYYITEDVKLVCLYHPNNDDYKEYENKVLLKHTRLCDVYEIDKSNKIFIFDFSDLENDWKHFLEGKYSQISKKSKTKILEFFEKNSPNYVYMKSYLYPEKYFDDYAECLDVEVDMLKSVGELCEKPNVKSETLIMKKSNLQNTEIIN